MKRGILQRFCSDSGGILQGRDFASILKRGFYRDSAWRGAAEILQGRNVALQRFCRGFDAVMRSSTPFF